MGIYRGIKGIYCVLLLLQSEFYSFLDIGHTTQSEFSKLGNIYSHTRFLYYNPKLPPCLVYTWV